MLGCNGVVGSNARYDVCGICNGDNSTCNLKSGIFTRQERPGGQLSVTKIPLGATSINITFVEISRNHLSKND